MILRGLWIITTEMFIFKRRILRFKYQSFKFLKPFNDFPLIIFQSKYIVMNHALQHLGVLDFIS